MTCCIVVDVHAESSKHRPVIRDLTDRCATTLERIFVQTLVEFHHAARATVFDVKRIRCGKPNVIVETCVSDCEESQCDASEND